MTSTTDIRALAERLREKAAELRGTHDHAEANRDDWFATLPPDVSAEWLAEAALYDQCAEALSSLTAERDALEDRALAAEQNQWHAEAELAELARQLSEADAVLDQIFKSAGNEYPHVWFKTHPSGYALAGPATVIEAALARHAARQPAAEKKGS